MNKDAIYPLYLEQMQGLQQFRQSYHGHYRTEALESDDPELQRLTEALAYCSAHAQHLGQASFKQHQRTLVAQVYPFMLSPLPAKTLVQLQPSEKLPQRMTIKAGTELHLASESGTAAIFRTCRDLPLLPMTLQRVDAKTLGLRDVEVSLSFRAFKRQFQAPGTIPILLDIYQDVLQTLKVLYAFESAKCSASFDNSESRYPCAFTVPNEVFYPGMHPVESTRQKLHHPSSEFCTEWRVNQSPASWQEITLHVRVKSDLLPGWQTDYFKPFCVPIINLQRANAKRLKVDGTQAHFPILPQEGDTLSTLHSVLGVYQIEQQNRRPLPPNMINSAVAKNSRVPGFDIDWHSEKNDVRTLNLNLPTAFTRPCSVDVEAHWHQPEFSTVFWQKMQVSPLALEVPGVTFSLIGQRTKYQASNVSSEMLNSLLGVRSHEVLTPWHVNAIVTILSLEWNEVFELISESYMGAVALSGPNQFAVQINLTSQHLPLIRLFLSYLEAVIRTWFAPQNVNLTLELLA